MSARIKLIAGPLCLMALSVTCEGGGPGQAVGPRTVWVAHDVSAVAISADGGRVAFVSGDPSLEADRKGACAWASVGLDQISPRGCRDVYVYEVGARTVRRVSGSTPGEPADGVVLDVAISADGNHVAFSSVAKHLSTVGDRHRCADDEIGGNRCFEVVVRDLDAGRGAIVSADLARHPSISGDGRFVAFTSWDGVLLRDRDPDGDGRFDDDRSAATNLTHHRTMPTISADGSTLAFDGYLMDRVSSVRRVVSNAPWRGSGEGEDSPMALSADGRRVAFTTISDLHRDGTSLPAVYVYDLDTKTVALASAPAPRVAGRYGEIDRNAKSYAPSGSGRMRYVTFTSDRTLTGEDAGSGCVGLPDVFVRDLESGRTVMISRSVDGRCGDGFSVLSAASSSGKVVAFTSWAHDLAPRDPGLTCDLYVRLDPLAS